MNVISEKNNSQIITNLFVANTFVKRFKGLMLKKTMDEKSALLIKPCNSIHTFFMLISIDVVFLDKNNKIIYLIEGMKPWRFSKIITNSKSVIEFSSGTINKNNIELGDVVIIE